jgi:hypothetical protein
MEISAFLKSWGDSGVIVSCKAQEDSAFTGCNRLLTTVNQFVEVIALSDQASELLPSSYKTYNLAFIPVCISVFHYLLANHSDKSTLLFRTVHWLHGNLGSLCQVASIVTCIALFHLGHTTYAVTSLAIVSIGYLERRNYLPLSLRRVYNSVSPWVGDIGCLLYGHWLLKLLTAPVLIDKTYRLLFRKHEIPYEKAVHSSHLADYKQFKNILIGRVELEVNRDHVWIAPFPFVEVRNFEPLKAFCNDFVWPINQLRAGLENDPRWDLSQDKIESEKGERVFYEIQYAKQQFQTLIKSIEEENIETGEVLDYGILKQYLGYITEKLPLASRELQNQIMIQLAVEGGNYCGPGIYYQLELAATTLLVNDPSRAGERLPLKQRILLVLQQERLRIIESFHMLIARINGGIQLIRGGKRDIHAMNSTIELIGNDFGLPDQGSKHDMTARMNIIDRWISQLFTRTRPEMLWSGVKFYDELYEGNTVQRIVRAVQTQMGLPLIPNGDVYAWANNWIEKASISPAERERFLERLGNAGFESFGGKFQNNFLKAMLFDMGILQIKKDPQTAAVPVISIPLLQSMSQGRGRV